MHGKNKQEAKEMEEKRENTMQALKDEQLEEVSGGFITTRRVNCAGCGKSIAVGTIVPNRDYYCDDCSKNR